MEAEAADSEAAPEAVDSAVDTAVVSVAEALAEVTDPVATTQMKVEAQPMEIDLRGMESVEAICTLELYLDSAMRSSLKQVRIIHGKGTGVLRAAVQAELRKNKFVKKFRLGTYGEGEDGVTIAELS